MTVFIYHIIKLNTRLTWPVKEEYFIKIELSMQK